MAEVSLHVKQKNIFQNVWQMCCCISCSNTFISFANSISKNVKMYNKIAQGLNTAYFTGKITDKNNVLVATDRPRRIHLAQPIFFLRNHL